MTQLELLKERIPYEENIFGDNTTYEAVLNRLLDDSKFICLSLRFPYQDYSSMSIPDKYLNWQLRASVEIYSSLGRENIKSYSENGTSWTKDGSVLSKDLTNEIEQIVGYIPISDENV